MDLQTIANEWKARREFSRPKPKKQFTIRVDEQMARAALAYVERLGVRFTDLMEVALWEWLERHKNELEAKPGDPLELR